MSLLLVLQHFNTDVDTNQGQSKHLNLKTKQLIMLFAVTYAIYSLTKTSVANSK